MLQRIGNDVKVQLGLLMVVVSRDKVAIGYESVRHVMPQLMPWFELRGAHRQRRQGIIFEHPYRKRLLLGVFRI